MIEFIIASLAVSAVILFEDYFFSAQLKPSEFDSLEELFSAPQGQHRK